MLYRLALAIEKKMTELQQRNEAFQTFLDTLNPAQREAVDQVEGPVLVVAGPGTGKTHLLTARIGNILLRTDARPQNILCLTFTDAGASAMRQRLLQRIGPEAQRVPIFTFHAFCNRIIQENAEQFGKGSPEPVTELERIEMVRGLLAKLSPEHPLRAGKKDVYLFEEHLRELFSTMKKEAWTPGYVLKRSDEFLNGLPTNPAYIYQRNSKTFKKGDPKTAQIADVTEKIERLKSAADLFPKYLHAMERAVRYEYEDMLLWVAKAFEKNEALLRTYQERFQYILVDEFQDTNGAQFHLLNLLLDFWEVPNIFIVGDDDQSIYEFQGARLQNLRAFQERYHKGLKTIVLEENYRSTQPILDAASRVIENNALRVVNLFGAGMTKQLKARMVDEDKNLTGFAGSAGFSNETHPVDPVNPVNKNQSGKILVKNKDVLLQSFPNRLQETTHVVQQIENLIAQQVLPSEIAVLYARHRQAERLLALLEKKGIPYQTKRPVNVLDLPVIQHFRALLSYLKEESERPFSGEPRLFRLLHAGFWGLSELDLAKIALASLSERNESRDEQNEAFHGNATRNDPRKPWRELLCDEAALNRLNLSAVEPFLRLGKQLNAWIADVQNLPLSQLIERLYAQTGLLNWALKQPDKAWYLQVLHSFMEFVRSETMRNPRRSLAKLLELLDSMDDNKLPLSLNQAAQQTIGIQLLTAHAAKGLEFGYVFMLDCTEDTWDKNAGGNRGHFYLPETLTRSGEEDALEARRRLFYVAMTRAKYQLRISFPRADDAGKSLIQSQFLAETTLPILEMAVPYPALLEAQTMLMLEAPQPVVTLPTSAVLDAFLTDFTLSITALNRYLRCPLAFYYEDVLKVPGATSEAAAFGSAMHAALQQFLMKMKSHKKYEWPSAEALSKIFNLEMEHRRGLFSEQGFAQRLALGKDHLRRIHVEQVPYWRKRAVAERRIDRVELEGIPLTGMLDKIEWLDGGLLRIVDYKTGTPDPKKTAAPAENQVLGGEYWRQLAFYQILLDKARLYPESVGKTAISWLAPDKRGTFPITEISFGSEALHFVEGLIREVYGKIQARDFDTGCGKKDCSWCEMQRERNVPEGLQRGEEEDLDDA
ncbi:MAG: ATP-dependent DNA helicase [Saprospiraceae bacterium]|nr:ATP-dependent DNA helicase [Saprospiraceae bacterium]